MVMNVGKMVKLYVLHLQNTFYFQSCTNTIALPLNMRGLKELKLFKCRDFSEQDVIDGLLYGKLVGNISILSKSNSITSTPEVQIRCIFV